VPHFPALREQLQRHPHLTLQSAWGEVQASTFGGLWLQSLLRAISALAPEAGCDSAPGAQARRDGFRGLGRGVSIVALHGRIVLGEESNSLREKVKSLIGQGKKKIVLNMANVTYIDSAGLGMLVAAHVSAKAQGVALHLSNLGNKFHDVLQLTRLLTVFSVYNTEAEAISRFGTGSLAATV
jgi:anti-sigma B factor antagonist